MSVRTLVQLRDIEWSVLREIATGDTYEVCAKRLGIPYQSFKNYTMEIKSKLGAQSTIEALGIVGWLVVPQ